MNFSIRKITNGCIVKVDGAEMAFSSPRELGEFILGRIDSPVTSLPVTLGLYLLNCPSEKKISCIKLIRELSGRGLREAKDVADGTVLEPIVESTNEESLRSIAMRFSDFGAELVINPLSKGHPYKRS